jgi:hypothetical protein
MEGARLLPHLLVGDDGGVIARERGGAGEHLVHNAAERIYIGGGADRLTGGLLG